jgi:hypothetical protein
LAIIGGVVTQTYAVITGDVIASKGLDQTIWMPSLKGLLNEVCLAHDKWELFRGDGFQLLLTRPEEVLRTAIRIKAGFKRIKDHDLRMAIGIGEIDFLAEKVGESNGEALIRAGALIDQLPDLHTTLAVTSPWPQFDIWCNPSLAMAAALMDKWLPNYAEAVAIVLKSPSLRQTEQAKLLGIKQNTLSERLTRAHRRELFAFESVFRYWVKKHLPDGSEA